MFMPINEQLSFNVSFGGNVKASATTTINDTIQPEYEYMLVASNPSSTEITEIDIPTYTLASNKTSVNEGETITFTLSTTMLDTGTIVPYTISDVSVSDISLPSLTGNFITDATGKATLTLSLIEDALTEGTETLTISINGQSATRSVTINDTSTTVIENNHLLFTVGTLSGNNRVLKGYDNGMEGVYGNLLNDTLKYGGQLLDSLASTIHYREDNGGLALQYWYNNYATIWENPLNFKITNMTTGEYYITGNVSGGNVTFNGVYWHDVPTASVDLLNRIYTVGQNVKVELI
jgi:hypothetical protein